jgi:hypothetical protein
MLTNPDFETGPTGGAPQGWIAFGNMAVESNNPPAIVPYAGERLLKMWGNWSGPWNVTGVFQEFPSAEGDMWQLSAKSRHYSGDAMVGSQAGGGNFVVQKIVFKNATDGEIGAIEATILDGSFATDTWFDNLPIVGTAPPGTAQVEAFILYIQPDTDGGAAQIDNVELLYLGVTAVEESSWGTIKSLYE